MSEIHRPTVSGEPPAPTFPPGSEPDAGGQPISDGAADAEPSAPGSDCMLCGQSFPPGSLQPVNGHPTCQSCLRQVRAELEQEQSQQHRLPLAIVGGGVGALVSAALWAAITVITELEIGYVAILLGLLAGHGVKLGAGRGRGALFQVIACGWAFVGFVVARYLQFAHYLVKSVGKDGGPALSYFDSQVLNVFANNLGELVGFFDILWVVLALAAAYRVPRASQVSIS